MQNDNIQEQHLSEKKDFRLYLQSILVNRCQKNNKYSLRAFARSLDLDHSTLSQILRGKRSLTKRMQQKLAVKLGLGPEEMKEFKEPSLLKKKTSEEAKEYMQLTIDTFAVSSDWYYFAILSLLLTRDFTPDVKWIGKVLGITVNEVNIAVERLVRLGLLKIDEDGIWKDGTSGCTTSLDHNYTTVARKKLQKQLLEKAMDAMDDYSIEKRSQTGMTMAINTKRIPEAKKMIKEFQRKLCDHLEQDDNKNEVYQLGISLYPLSKCGDLQ